MSGLSSAERSANIENAFSLSENAANLICGKKILLVDDIYTTGSTASECSRILMEKGAAEVCVVTFAAGANLLKVDRELLS